MNDNWQLNHLGFMVTDRNAVLRHFQSLGVGVSVGPQPLMPHEDGEGSLTFYRTLHGDPVTSTYPTGGAHNFRDGESQIGDCQLECYPMKPGPGMFISEYLALKGPGINHICFNVPDIEQETRRLKALGCELVFDARVNGKTVENYLDTRRHGDVMISLRPPATPWEQAWKANNQSHPLVNNWQFQGVGIGVGNLAEAVQYYSALGFPAVRAETEDQDLMIRSRSVQVGPMTYEFVQPLGADTVYTDSLSKRGDGINDLVFVVDDLEKETQRLVDRGVEVLASPPVKQSGAVTYFDTRQVGNIMLRLIQR